MATRGTISMVRSDGSVVQVYSHWDNYLENNGDILIKYYNTAEKVEALLAHGDISSLGQEVGEKHPFSHREANMSPGEYEDIFGNMTLYYGRDRGESDTNAREFVDVESYEKTGDSGMFEEFNYLFIGNRWYYKSYDGLVRDVERQLVLLRLKEKEPA